LLFVWSSSPAPADDAQPQQPTEPQKIISFLNQTIVWYRQQNELKQLANDPSDVLFLNDNEQVADDVVKQSFDFARNRALILNATATPSPDSQNPTASRYQNLAAATAKAEARFKEAQANIETLRRKLDTATGRNRAHLEAALAEAQSEVELIQTRRDALKNMTQFLSGAGGLGAGSLQSQIDELARTVPVSVTSDDKATTSTKSQSNKASVQLNASNQKKSEPSGILALITDLLSLRRKMETLDQAIDSTNQLTSAAKAIRSPMIADLRALMAKGDQLANAPESQDPVVLTEQKKNIDALTAQFKQNSAAVLPLGKQGILLDIYKRTLSNWRSSVETEHRAELKGLILRLVILGIIIAFIAGISEVWKKATFRYVHDVRRRYQFLLLRRIVVWIVIAIVIASAFAAELGTLATFAGLLTAGVAVALQNVILSVAGYFFLIGKYGVRVGDRVQIAGVTGDVIDIGLVRLHIMEVDTGVSNARATGRVVVFSNAVVFQPNAGLFKQIPGTNFNWHEIRLTLAAESNYHLVEQRLKKAVDAVYGDYKSEMENQRRRMEQSLNTITTGSLDPESRLRLTQSGLEVVIRYPVDLTNAASIDDAMARALLDAIGQEPRLRLVGSGTPNIQAVPEPAPTTVAVK
jgi:small-conductance mechanosensitive channel